MSDVRAELEARLSSVQHSAEEQVTHVKVELESAQAKLQVSLLQHVHVLVCVSS